MNVAQNRNRTESCRVAIDVIAVRRQLLVRSVTSETTVLVHVIVVIVHEHRRYVWRRGAQVDVRRERIRVEIGAPAGALRLARRGQKPRRCECLVNKKAISSENAHSHAHRPATFAR